MIGGRSWDLDADVVLAEGRGGVIYASGTENSGLSVFVDSGRLVFDYNLFGEHHIVESTTTIGAGAHRLSVRFRREGKTGAVELLVDDRSCGSLNLPFVMRTMSSVGPSVGYDHGSPVALAYAERRDGYPFEGDLERLEIRLVSPKHDADVARAEARAAMGRQ